MEDEKRKNEKNKLAHKLPLIHETQFLFTMQEGCSSTFNFFFLTLKPLTYLIWQMKRGKKNG